MTLGQRILLDVPDLYRRVIAQRFASYVIDADAEELSVLVALRRRCARIDALLDRVCVSERLGVERLYHVRVESRRRLGPLARRVVQTELFRHVDREHPATRIM